MLASNCQMPANGWNGIIELPLEGSGKWEETQSFWELWDWILMRIIPSLSWVLRSGICGTFPESWDTGDKIPAAGASQTQQIPKWRHSSEENQLTLAVPWWNAEEIVELWNHYGWKSPLRALSPTTTTTPPQENEKCVYFISLALTTATNGPKRRGGRHCGLCLLLPARPALGHLLPP